MAEELSKDYDEFLNHRESILNVLNSLGFQITADNITGGVFGAASSTSGIAFGTDPSTNKSYLQSRNFITGSTGWQILSDGSAEFRNITVGGYIQVGGAAADVNAGAVTISGGKITADSITATQISSSYIYTNTLTAEQITAGTLTGRTVQTASGGKNVKMEAAGTYGNMFTFYDTSLAVTPIARLTTNVWSLEIRSSAGVEILADGLTPAIGITSDLGYSTAKWRHLFLSGNIYVDGTVDGIDISTHASTASAHHSSTSNGLEITPSTLLVTSISTFNNYIILPAIADPAVAAGKLFFAGTHFRGTDGSARRDLCYYDERNAASPIQTFESGIDELKKIKIPDKTMNYNPDAFSDDYKLKINGEVDKDRLDLKPIIGMLIKSQKELLQKVEDLELKIK